MRSMKDPERRNRIEVVGWAGVPFYQELYAYDWVSDFLAFKQKNREMRDLEQEKKRIERLPPDEASYTSRLKSAFENMQIRQKSNLTNFLRERLNTPNAFQFYQLRVGAADMTAPFYLPPWEEFETAIAGFDFTGGIADNERAKELKKISARLESLDQDLQKLGHEDFRNRQEFVTFWRTRQALCTGAISPCGVTLEKSPKAEQAAWKTLRMDKLVLSHNQYLPHPGDLLNLANLIPPAIEDVSLLGRAKKIMRGRRVIHPGLRAA